MSGFRKTLIVAVVILVGFVVAIWVTCFAIS